MWRSYSGKILKVLQKKEQLPVDIDFLSSNLGFKNDKNFDSGNLHHDQVSHMYIYIIITICLILFNTPFEFFLHVQIFESERDTSIDGETTQHGKSTNLVIHDTHAYNINYFIK